MGSLQTICCNVALWMKKRYFYDLQELSYKNYQMIVLLPLIILAAAQQCPYCRWNACSQTNGGLYTCNDCYLGALVNFQLPDLYLERPVNIGICMLCPDVCVTCQYAVIGEAHNPPLMVLNCTSCISQRVVSYYNGTCVPCPGACDTCICGPSNCSTTICTKCVDGYTLNQTQNTCVANQGRLLIGPDSIAAQMLQDSSQSSVSLLIDFASLLAVLLVGSLLGKRDSRRKKVSFSECQPKQTTYFSEDTEK